MTQFRLTQKFATALKIKQLADPNNTTPHPLDDWFIDSMQADRKKIAISLIQNQYLLFLSLMQLREELKNSRLF